MKRTMFVTTYQPIGGWRAVMYWWNPEMGGFWEPWSTGFHAFATEEPAAQDARIWAQAEGVPYIARGEKVPLIGSNFWEGGPPDHSGNCPGCDSCSGPPEYEPDDGGYAEAMEMQQLRLETTPRPEGLKVWTRYGSEGPRHDPYSFTIFHVTLPSGQKVRYHCGLGEELEVDGQEMLRGDGCATMFEDIVGFPRDQLEYWADEPYRDVPCMACGREGCRGGCCE